jgi:probable phosphoglycerate mutase
MDPDLRELCSSDLEPRPEAELCAQWDPDTMFTEALHGRFAGIPGRDLGGEYLARVRSAFRRIERSRGRGHVLVMSHGLTLLAHMTMVDPRPTSPLPDARISTIEVNPDSHRRMVTIALDPAGHGVSDLTCPHRRPLCRHDRYRPAVGRIRRNALNQHQPPPPASFAEPASGVTTSGGWTWKLTGYIEPIYPV